MAFCANCGKPLPDGARICEVCGAPVLTPPKSSQSIPTSIAQEVSQNPIQHSEQDDFANVIQEATHRQGSLQQQASPQSFQRTAQEIDTPSAPRKKSMGPMILGAVAVLAVILFFLKPSGWSTEDAQAATQAHLDAVYMGDSESLAKYMNEKTVEDLDTEREELRQEMISSTFKETVPVTQELKTRYADFYLSLMGKARYEVGEASKTEDGFEVPVKVWPITSLAHGDYVLLDMQLNDELSDADLNERFYSRELELMTELTENPTYGDPQEIIIHITKGEAGYEFSEADDREIADCFYTLDRHWTKERTKNAVEAVLGGVYKEQYEELAKWTVATQDEIEGVFSNIFTKDTMKGAFDELSDEMTRDMGLEETYEIPDEILENLSVAFRAVMSGTEYEVLSITGGEDEYIAELQITPITTESKAEEMVRQLEAEVESMSRPEEFIDRFWELMSELALQAVEEGEYGHPIHRTLHLRFNNNKAYELDNDDFLTLFDISSDDLNQEDVGESSSTEGESLSDDTDNEPKDSAASVSEGETYSSGKNIPLLVKGTKIVLGETTLQDFLDKTGLTMGNSEDTFKTDYSEEIEIETGDDDTFLSLTIKKDDSTKEIKECCIYEVTYSDYSSSRIGQNAIVSFGSLTVGNTREDVITVFGKPYSDDDYSVSYYMDDDTYSLYFGHEDGIIYYMSFGRDYF